MTNGGVNPTSPAANASLQACPTAMDDGRGIAAACGQLAATGV